MNSPDDCHSYGGNKRKKEFIVIPTLQPLSPDTLVPAFAHPVKMSII
jgi:hypothetical protein